MNLKCAYCAVLAAVALAVAAPDLGAAPARSLAKRSKPTTASESMMKAKTADDVFISVAVPDLQGFLGKVDEFVNAAVGKNLETRKQLGTFLGDPTLDGLPAGSGGALLVFSDFSNTMLLEVAPAKAKDYQAAAEAQGRSVGMAGQIMVVSGSEANTSAGLEIAQEMAAKVLKPRAAQLRAQIAVNRILKQYEPQAQMALTLVPAQLAQAQARQESSDLPSTATARLIEAEMRVLYVVLSKVSMLQLEVNPSKEGIRINTTFVASEPPKTEEKVASVAELSNLIPAKAGLRMIGAFDPKSTSLRVQEVFQTVSEQMNIPPADRAGFTKLMSDWMDVSNGTVASVALMPGVKKLSGVKIAGVSDEQKALAVLAEMPANFDNGPIGKLLDQFGLDIKVKFERDVRKVGDVAIHKMSVELPFMTSSTQALKMLGDMSYEIAIVNKQMIAAFGTPIEPAIEAVKTGKTPDAKPLEAQSIFGPGGRAYIDYNIAEAIDLFGSSMSDTMPAEAAKMMELMKKSLDGAPPASVGCFVEGQKHKIDIFVPTELVKRFSDFGKEVKAESEKQDKAESAKDSKTESSKDDKETTEKQ